MRGTYRLFLCLLIFVSAFSGNVTIGNAATQSTFPIFDEQDPSAFTGGWGWDGFDASRTSAMAYSGTYSYAVTIPSGRTNSSEGWTGPLPDTTGANRLVFAYRKSNPNSSIMLYFFVNGYWHLVVEQGIGLDYQGWTIPRTTDTDWHEVVIDLSTEIQGYNGDPDVSPTGQLGNFQIAIYNQTPGDTIYFDNIRFETITDTAPPAVSLTTPTDGATVSGVVTVSATATDNEGVSYVKFYVNGAVAFTDTESPYNWTWDTAKRSDGAYTLQAKAYDASGNTGSSALVTVTVSNGLMLSRSFWVYDDQRPSTFTGGWGWDGFQASRSSATAYSGTYSYAVTIPSGRTNASEGWTGPLPDTTGANRLVFAYRKSNPNSSMMLYFFVNGYWHLVVEQGIGLDYQGWTIPRTTDTDWHEVAIDLSTETQGYNGDPDVSPTGQLGNFEIAVYNQNPGDTIYFDTIRFETLTDTAPPSVSLTTPTDDATVAGVVSVAADATDNVGVSRVEFYLDGILALTDSTSPYSWSWDTVNAAYGSHTLSAMAYDAAGNVGSSAQIQVNANVNNPDSTPPTAPSNVAATMISGSEVQLAWTASTDNMGVTGYQVERCQGAGCSNFMQVAASTGTTYNDTGLMSNTSYSYRVKATDAAGNLSQYSNTATLIIDTAPPLVSLTAPINGMTVSGAVTVTGDATDNVGVSRVEFYVNGGHTFTDTTSPYNWVWDTANGSDGVYALQAKAYDAEGNTGSSAVGTVIVSNGLIVSQSFWVYDEQDPSAFTGGWGWDGFQTSRSSATAYSGTYSYAVTIPSGRTNASEGWTGPLPDTTVANRLVFAYRKSNPNSSMMLYFFVNGYWHLVVEEGIGLDYQGWTVPMVTDTFWHEVVIDLSTEIQGYNGDPDVAPTGQLGNFQIAIYNQTPGDTIYFDSIRFETLTDIADIPEVSLTTPADGATISGPVTVAATATDNVAVSRVEFYVNGGHTFTDTTSPYNWTWDTDRDSDGVYVLEARAYDTAGNAGSSTIVNVLVNNGFVIGQSFWIYDEQDPSAFTGGWGWDGFQASRSSATAYSGTYSYAVTIPGGRTNASEGWTGPLPDTTGANRLMFAYRKSNPNSSMMLYFFVNGYWHLVVEQGIGLDYQGWTIPRVTDTFWHEVVIDLSTETQGYNEDPYVAPTGQLGNFQIAVYNQTPGDTIYFDSIRFDTLTDTATPSVSLTTPTDGATVSGIVTVAADAADNVGVSRVEFYLDGVLALNDTTSPYSWSWDTVNATYGSHTLSAKAYDAAGNVGSSAQVQVNANVNNPDITPPTAPSNVTATIISGSEIKLAWTASTDNMGVTGYQVERCQEADCSSFTQLAVSTGTTYNDTGLMNGTSYSYRMKATDATGNFSPYSNTATLILDTTPPALSLTFPYDMSTVSGVVAVTASVTDDVGVNKVEFYLNGAVTFTDVASPYNWSWDTMAGSDGVYTLQAKADDAAGNSGNSSVGTVIVSNGLIVSQSFWVYDEQDPSAFTGGWGWDGFQASRTSDASYAGAYSYAVTPPSGRTDSSEGWSGPLPNNTGANRLVFAYRKSNPNSYMMLYFYVNGYWHKVAEQGIGLDYQGWTISKTSDTLWHEVVIDLSTETQGYNGDPDVAPTGQLGNFEIAVYNQTAGDTIYFDSIRFETLTDIGDIPEVSLTTPTDGATVSGAVTVAATATDNVGVSRVEFYVNGGHTFTDTTSPYNWTWDTAKGSDGAYVLQAMAYDAAGNTGSSALVTVIVSNGLIVSQSFWVYDEQDPSAFTGGWGWDGFQASHTSDASYSGAYSYAVTPPSGRTDSSEGWSGPLPNNTGANRLVFAYRKSSPNSYMMLYFYVNGYWHKVAEQGIGLDYQGWTISKTSDTLWHEVVIDLSTETQGYNGDPDVAPTGQLGNFMIAVYNQTAGDTIYFDSIRFETLTDIVDIPEVSLTTPTVGATVSGAVTVAATATDNVGVSRVEFYVNGGHTFTDTTSPYNWTWDTAKGSDGVYTLQARVYDAAGNTGSSALVTVMVSNWSIVSQSFLVYDEQDTSVLTGGWGWDGFQASRSSATAYSGTYSYAVTIPSGRTDSSEGWTGSLPDTTGANRLVFAYRKSNPNSYMMLYFYVNGYWHKVAEQGIGLDYQGWTISKTSDTDWHEVVIDLSTETQGYNGDPDVAPTGQLGNFMIAVYNQTAGDTIYFDSIRFEKMNNMQVFDEQDPGTFSGGWGIDGFQASWTSDVAYTGSYSYAVTIPGGRTDSSEGWTSPLSDNSVAERLVFAYRKTNPNSTMFINFLASGIWHQVIEGELPPYYQGWKIRKVEDTDWHEVIIDLKGETSSYNYYTPPWGQLNGFEIGVKEGNPGDTIYFDSIRFEMPPIQAYASSTSVVQGDSINFHISTKYSSYDVNIYREGASKELMASLQGLPGRFYPVPANGYETGFNWSEAFTLQIPSNWKSGVYLAEIVSGQDKTYTIFVVKESLPGRTSSILYKLSVNTYQAYNRAGGKSLYESGSSENMSAVKVSLDRPYIYGSGAGDYFAWEVYFIRWLESNGYTVEYVTDVDVHADPTLIYNYKLLLSGGHDEYWSKEMRDSVEAFVSNGGNVAFFSGNTSWFQVRFENNNRTMVCYKWYYENDPLFGVDNSRVTTWWYDYPVNRPENSMTGVSWRNGGYVNFMGILPASDGYGGYQVYNSTHWVYQGTGLMDGQEFGQPETIVGYEVDGALFTFQDGTPVVTGEDGTPLNFIILGLSDTVKSDGTPGHATMGIYTKEDGGTVFTAATTDWSHGLATNAHVQQITRNILNTLSH